VTGDGTLLANKLTMHNNVICMHCRVPTMPVPDVLHGADNLCDCLDDPRPACQEPPCKTTGPFGVPQPGTELRQTCSKSPIPAEFLKDAATPGVCASYADTLIAVNEALKQQQIPIKHFQLDSW
jgi:hypothetical protein